MPRKPRTIRRYLRSFVDNLPRKICAILNTNYITLCAYLDMFLPVETTKSTKELELKSYANFTRVYNYHSCPQSPFEIQPNCIFGAWAIEMVGSGQPRSQALFSALAGEKTLVWAGHVPPKKFYSLGRVGGTHNSAVSHFM